MQKLVKRAAQAQRQAQRQGRRRMEQENIDVDIRNRQTTRAAVTEVRNNIKASRRARKEDWEMGPLAPKRDLGYNFHGAVTENGRLDWSNSGIFNPRPEILEKRCAWAGKPNQINLAPEDRVVILEGPDKGKIDRIKSIQAQTGSVFLQNRHRNHTSSPFDNNTRSQAMPLPISSVRLVYALRHPETGVMRDVIINQLKAVAPNMQSPNMSLDRWRYGNKWDRVAPGINVSIPWPDVVVPEYELHDADTVRDQVEERTFHYSLLSPPMPEQVLDELRNKFSRFRTRHEAWYVEKKEAEEADKKGRLAAIKSMQTPLDEFHEMQRELRAARGEPELSEEMLEKVGELMAKKKAEALDQAGATEVPSTPSSSPQ